MAKSSTEYYRQRRHKFINLRPGESPGRTMNGLLSVAIRTQSQVAGILGISPQAVQQIERLALYKLRQRLHKEIREYQTQ